MADKNLITSRQMALLTFVAQTGVGVIMLPTTIAKEVGRDGWIPVVLTGFLAVGLTMLIVSLLRRYGDKSIFTIDTLLFGKPIGLVLNLLLVIYLIIMAVVGIRIFGLFLKMTLYANTPPLILTVFSLLPSLYIVWQGFKVVCRFKYFTLLAYAAVVVYIVLIYKEYRISFLMPVGEAGIAPLLSGWKSSFFAYLGIELVVFMYPEITDKHQTMRWQIIATIGSMVFLTLVTLACTALFGENTLKNMIIPLFNLTRVMNAPILERVDLYLVGLWFVAMGCSMRAYIFAGYYSLQKVLHFKMNPVLYILYFAMLILVTRLVKDMNEALKLMELINNAGIGVVLFILICLALSFIRKKGVNAR